MADDIVIKVTLDDQGAVSSITQLGEKIEKDVGESLTKVTNLSSTFGTAIGTAFGNLAAIGIQKVSGLLVGLPGQLADLASRGADVDDVTSAFERLTQQAGGVADAFQTELRNATSGTIADFDLLAQANENLRAGIKPDEIIELTKAARALAEETGQDLKQSIDEVTQAFQTGRVAALQNRLGVIDLKAAESDLAKQLGITADQLSQEGQVTAARNALLEAARKKTEEFGEITADAADKTKSLGATLQNAKDQMAKALATSIEYNEALDTLANILKDIPLAEFATALISVTTATIGAANSMTRFVSEGLGELKKAATRSVTAPFEEAMIRVVDLLNKDTPQATKLAVTQFNLLKAEILKNKDLAFVYGQDMVTLGHQIDAVTKSSQSAAKGISDFAKGAEGAAKGVKGAADKTGDLNSNLIDNAKLTEAAKVAAEKAAKAYEAATEALDKKLDKIKDLNSPGGILSYSQALQDTYQDSIELKFSSTELLTALENLQREYLEAGLSAENLAIGTANAAASLQNLGKTAQDVSAETSTAISAIGSALSSIILDGADVEQTLRGLGSQLGGIGGKALAASLGLGPVGELIGQELGSLAGEALVKGLADVFGGKDNAGTKFRKALDKFFAEAFDANRLSVIINGQLKQIKDLEFGGTDFGNADLGFFDAFNKLPDAARAAFDGVSRAFAELTGNSQDFASSLAAVFTNNLGGSLNNLQLLIQATGKTAEEMKGAIVEAFLDGKLSALEAQSAINGINQAMQEGIPDAVGAVSQAFDNLKAAGAKGGRAATDALRDIGAEAKEVGSGSLEEVINNLAATGKYSAEEIRQVFDALKAAGIDTVEELASATDQSLIGVLSQLEATDFPFAKAAEEAQQLIDKVNQLPDEIRTRLVFDVEMNVDERDREVIQRAPAASSALGNSGLGYGA